MPKMTAENFVRIVWTVLEIFEILIDRPGEKRYDCISQKFVQTPALFWELFPFPPHTFQDDVFAINYINCVSNETVQFYIYSQGDSLGFRYKLCSHFLPL